MAIDERRRHAMYLFFEDLAGAEVATTLMEHLPPVGWADVATRHDVEHETALLRSDLERETAVLRSEMGVLRGEISILHHDLSRQITEATNRMLRWTIGITIPAFVTLNAAVIVVR